MAKDREGRQRGTDDSFTGRATQLTVMAEVLRLHCNAAIPEVDLGTDVFVFKDDREEVVRLQVKACTAPHVYADGSGSGLGGGDPTQSRRRASRLRDPTTDGAWLNLILCSAGRRHIDPGTVVVGVDHRIPNVR